MAALICAGCGVTKRHKDFPRKNGGGYHDLCRTCRPARMGPEPKRVVAQDEKYNCAGCGGSFTVDFYDVRKLPSGTYVVMPSCRACERDRRWQETHGADSEEAKLISDVIYDFDLARNMFGMNYPDAVAWLLRGYRLHGVTETKIRDWGMTETRRETWRPDEYQPD